VRTVAGRSDPPMIVPEGSKGDELPKSIMIPVFLPSPFHVTLVPGATQIATGSFGKFGMFGVTEASSPPPVRLISRTQGELLDPQVFAAVQSCSGCRFEQTDGLVFLSFAAMLPSISNSPIAIRTKLDPIARKSSVSFRPYPPTEKVSQGQFQTFLGRAIRLRAC
jgi:hypothetical protein